MDDRIKTKELHIDQIDPCPLPFCASRDDSAPLF